MKQVVKLGFCGVNFFQKRLMLLLLNLPTPHSIVTLNPTYILLYVLTFHCGRVNIKKQFALMMNLSCNTNVFAHINWILKKIFETIIYGKKCLK